MKPQSLRTIDGMIKSSSLLAKHFTELDHERMCSTPLEERKCILLFSIIMRIFNASLDAPLYYMTDLMYYLRLIGDELVKSADAGCMVGPRDKYTEKSLALSLDKYLVYDCDYRISHNIFKILKD